MKEIMRRDALKSLVVLGAGGITDNDRRRGHEKPIKVEEGQVWLYAAWRLIVLRIDNERNRFEGLIMSQEFNEYLGAWYDQCDNLMADGIYCGHIRDLGGLP